MPLFAARFSHAAPVAKTDQPRQDNQNQGLFESASASDQNGAPLAASADVSPKRDSGQKEADRAGSSPPAIAAELFEKQSRPKSQKDARPAPKPLSLKFESAVVLSKNHLLRGASSWQAGIPYTEISLSYTPSAKTELHFGMDFHYRSKWSFGVTELSAGYSLLAWPLSFQSLKFQAGFFEYPLPFLSKNKKDFSKETLLRQALPLPKDEDIGMSLKWNLYKKALAFQAAAFFPRTEREFQKEFRADKRPLLVMKLVADSSFGHAFAGGIRRYPADNQTAAASRGYGAGGCLSFNFSRFLKTKALSFYIQGEVWGIQKSAPSEITLSGYVFPRLKWDPFSAGFLWGAAGSYHPKKPRADGPFQLIAAAPASEQLIQISWDITENISLSWEKFIEEDSVLRQKAWSLSLKTRFSL